MSEQKAVCEERGIEGIVSKRKDAAAAPILRERIETPPDCRHTTLVGRFRDTLGSDRVDLWGIQCAQSVEGRHCG